MPAPVVPVLVVPPQPAPLVVSAAPLTVTVAPLVSLPPAPVDLPVYAAPGRITLGAAPSSPPAWVQWVLSVLRLPWKGNNWRTSVTGVVIGCGFLVAHKGELLAVTPDRLHNVAVLTISIATVVLGLISKDAGNHSPPQADAPPSLSL